MIPCYTSTTTNAVTFQFPWWVTAETVPIPPANEPPLRVRIVLDFLKYLLSILPARIEPILEPRSAVLKPVAARARASPAVREWKLKLWKQAFKGVN